MHQAASQPSSSVGRWHDRIRLLSSVVLAAVMAAMTLAPAVASARIRIETQTAQTPNGSSAVALLVNGMLVASLAKEYAGSSPQRLVSAAASRLSAAYRSGRVEIEIKQVDDIGRNWQVLLNERVLLSAHDAEAKAWGVEPQALALTWQRRLRDALGESRLEPPTSRAGSEPAGLTASPPTSTTRIPPKLEQLSIQPASARLTSTPSLPPGAILTGSQPTTELINAAIDAALRFEQAVAGNSPLLWKQLNQNPSALRLSAGSSLEMQLECMVAGEPVRTTLALHNCSLELPSESLTMDSRNPERIFGPQLLYSAELDGLSAARLVFHHQCQHQGGLRFVVRVLSTENGGALHVIPGTATDINGYNAGFRSGEQFRRNIELGNGYAAPLASDEQVILLSQQLDYGFTTSGYMKLTNLTPAPLKVELLALPANDRLPDRAIRPADSTSTMTQATPLLSYSGSYSAGQGGSGQLELPLGTDSWSKPQESSAAVQRYGLTQHFSIELSNPSRLPALVFVVFRASSGEAKGLFRLDGEPLSTPLLGAGEELLLREVPLPPGASQRLTLESVSLNGSSYPAAVILRESRRP